MSVIIPSYRQPQFLERAIVSCLEQDHSDLEVIVVEDRSMDSSLGLAVSWAKRDSRVRVAPAATNGGLGKARNIGIAQARGEFLCFLDADDYLLDRSISARLEAWPEAVASYGDRVVGVYGDWQHVAELIDHPDVRDARTSMPLVSAATYSGENAFICSAPLVKRSVVVDAGGFPEGLRMLEDFALWAKIVARGGMFVPVQHVVATYRQRPNSMLRGDGIVNMAEHVEVINEWMERSGVSIIDGGAMRAWLANGDPRPFGRMSWNVPSVLGSFGGNPGASAVQANALGDDQVEASDAVHDFMSDAVAEGLRETSSSWVASERGLGARAVSVSSLADSLCAVALAELAHRADVHIGFESVEPASWPDLWPLALAGVDAWPTTPTPDLAMGEFSPEERTALLSRGLSTLWPRQNDRDGSCVFVPQELIDHPALDAWLSTSLHALAERGLAPFVMADPRVRRCLGGVRAELTSIERVLSSRVIVAPACGDAEWLRLCAPLVTFDPMRPTGDHVRTRRGLDDALSDVGQRAVVFDPAPSTLPDETVLERLQR